ncbi:MAG: sialidase family protein [Burkholderiaceae bacterium]
MKRHLRIWTELMFAAACTFSLLAACGEALAQPAAGHSSRPAELGATTAADGKGRLWSVSKQAGTDGMSALVLRRSEDSGKTWSAPLPIANEAVAARGEERPKIAFGPKGELYILYTKPRGGSGNPHIGDIRFVRSSDGAKTFSQPIYPHANRDAIVHSFGSMIVDKTGTLYVVWIDNRDKEAAKTKQEAYAGNGLYYAVSKDGGKTFSGDYKIADHTCECCRLSLSLNPQGRPVVMWRHIFDPNIRDHAIAALNQDGKASQVDRATFDDWRIDACPHHGPSIAYGPGGVRHQAWFNVKEGEGGIFYAHAGSDGELSAPVKLGTSQAKQPDVAANRNAVAIVWKQFDGEATALIARVSTDKGRSWTEKQVARTAGDSDRPQLLQGASGMLVAWPTQDEGMRVFSTEPSSRTN